jgi:lysozyme family protein
MSTFELAIPVILKHEGGWVNDPHDLGAETNYGWSTLTIKRLGLTASDLGIPGPMFATGYLKPMTEATAVKLYRKYFWDLYGYGRINDQKAATKLFDLSVNCGPKRAHTMAQKAINRLQMDVDVDGDLGPQTVGAINSRNPQAFVNELCDVALEYYQAIVKARPQNAKFLNNWTKRSGWGRG